MSPALPGTIRFPLSRASATPDRMKPAQRTLLYLGLLVAVLLGIGELLSPTPFTFAPFVPIAVVLALVLAVIVAFRRFLAVVATHKQSTLRCSELLATKRFDDAEAAVAGLARSRLAVYRRMFGVNCAIIAMGRGDRDAALAALDLATGAPVGILFRGTQATLAVQARSLRAFLRAGAGDVAGARDDIAAVRAAPEPAAACLARASLAEARLFDETGDKAALGAVLERDRWLLHNATGGAERGLVRAYETMLEASAGSVYRQRADREAAADEAPETAAWVARFAPSAAPFVRGPDLPAGTAGGSLAEAPSEAARAKVAAARPGKVPVPANHLASALWLVGIFGFVGLWAAPEGTMTPAVTRAAWVVLTLGVAAVIARAVLQARREARRLKAAEHQLAVGELSAVAADLELEAKSPTRRAQAASMLAEAALRRGDPEEALRQCERGFVAVALAQNGTLVAPVAPADGKVAPWDLPRALAAQRAAALAVLGREDEAWAEIEWAKGFPTGYQVFRVLLLTRLHAGDHEGAARAVEARDPTFALFAADEILAKLARFVGRPSSRTVAAAARLRGELSRDPTLKRWVDVMAPGLLDAFERAAAETDAPSSPTAHGRSAE